MQSQNLIFEFSYNKSRPLTAGNSCCSVKHQLSLKSRIFFALTLIVWLSACHRRPISTAPLPIPLDSEVQWYMEHSMLSQAPDFSEPLSGNGAQWQEPFGLARPEAFLGLASVWFNAYPESLITRPGDSVIEGLSDPYLLKILRDIGIEAIHTGPLKRAGSVRRTSYEPTIDGYFDRIELAIDPAFGSDDQYRELVGRANKIGIAIIGDMIPGHTGKGPDFRLAELGVPGFAGLYSMVEIDRKDWALLPEVPSGDDSVNLSRETALALKRKKYIVGPLEAVIFQRPGIKESNWSATDVVQGVDGKKRRWVYVHFFKRGQPSLNWLDPSFAAHRMLAADILHSLRVLGARGLRLDANMFLGFEPRPSDEPGWLLEHPLSTLSTEMLAMLIRKVGGFSFQELNVSLDQVHATLSSGPELGYDFTTRPAYIYALATGDAGPLRLMLRLMLQYEVPPGRMVHALQNHDELMLETTHLKVHGETVFEYEGGKDRGAALFEKIYSKSIAMSTGGNGPYNESFAMSPGVCSTLCGFTAASLGYNDLTALDTEQVATIRQRHLAAAAYNALQPGAFAVSGWDLAGALPVDRNSVKEHLADNDCRWLNRGAYDLAGLNPKAASSEAGLPRAVSLYGPLTEQLRDPASFASTLKRMLILRGELGIDCGKLVAVPEVTSPGLVLMLVEPPGRSSEKSRRILTAINFGQEAANQMFDMDTLGISSARIVFSTVISGSEIPRAADIETAQIQLNLAPSEAQLLLLEGPVP
jgi:trehalose synthase